MYHYKNGQKEDLDRLHIIEGYKYTGDELVPGPGPGPATNPKKDIGLIISLVILGILLIAGLIFCFATGNKKSKVGSKSKSKSKSRFR